MSGLRLLWDRRRFLAGCTLGGIVLATIIAFTMPKTYKAAAKLMPPEQQNGGLAMLAAMSGGNGPGLGLLAGDLLGTKSTGALFIAILQSRTVEDHLIQQFDLRKVYRTEYYENARKRLEANTAISEDRRNGVISINVTDHDPKRAAAIGAAYVAELDRAIAELSTSSARRERIFLETRLAAVKQDLDSAGKELGEFSSRHTTIDIQEQGKAMLEGMATLQGQMIAAESELEALKQIYSEDNVRVRAAGAKVAELKQALRKFGGVQAGTNSPDKSSGGADGGSGIPSVRQLPLLGVQWSDLYRRAKIQEVVFETLSKEYELAKVQEAKEIPTVRVLDAPQVPERKSGPPRLEIMVLGMLLAFMASAFWTILQSYWSNLDQTDERKVLFQEVLRGARSSLRFLRPHRSSETATVR